MRGKKIYQKVITDGDRAKERGVTETLDEVGKEIHHKLLRIMRDYHGKKGVNINIEISIEKMAEIG